MPTAPQLSFTPFGEYLGRDWHSEVSLAGESFRVHKTEIAVDAIYT